MYQTLPSINRWSLEITPTVPLKGNVHDYFLNWGILKTRKGIEFLPQTQIFQSLELFDITYSS